MAYDEMTFALSLHIDPDLISRVQEIPEDCIFIEGLKARSQGWTFRYDFTERFGFDECGTVRAVDGYTVIEFVLPEAKYSDDVCSECQGTGIKRISFEDRPCYFCKGLGEELISTGTMRHAICLTTYALFWLLESALINGGRERYEQHAVYVSSVISQPGGMAFAGGVSVEFMAAITELYAELVSKPPESDRGTRAPSFEFDQAESAMVSAWLHMSLSDSDRLVHEMRAELYENGRVYVECPGQNGCSVYTSSQGMPVYFSNGQNMDSHNVDSTMQQLALMIGFAKVYEEVVKKIPQRSD